MFSITFGFFNDLGRVWGGSWEGLGKVLGGFWEGFGKVLGRFLDALGAAQGYFYSATMYAVGSCKCKFRRSVASKLTQVNRWWSILAQAISG